MRRSNSGERRSARNRAARKLRPASRARASSRRVPSPCSSSGGNTFVTLWRDRSWNEGNVHQACSRAMAPRELNRITSSSFSFGKLHPSTWPERQHHAPDASSGRADSRAMSRCPRTRPFQRKTAAVPRARPAARSTIPERLSNCSKFRVRRRRAAVFCETSRTWQGRRDSNPRPSVLETDALPTELHPYRALPLRQCRTRIKGKTSFESRMLSARISGRQQSQRAVRHERPFHPAGTSSTSRFAANTPAPFSVISRGCSRRRRTRRCARPRGWRSAGPSPSRSARSAPP